MPSSEADKRVAALAAVAEVRDGMRIGLGTGSTARFAIEEVARRHREDGLRVEAVATSRATADLATAGGLRVLPLEEIATLDLAIDGADEFDPALRAIKGAGGAMLREKLVARAAARMIVIADGSKRVERLGARPVPVEFLPLARAFVERAARALGAVPVPRTAVGGAYHTDQGNPVFDCRFADIGDPAALAAALSAVPGVVGHGLFVDEVDAVYVASGGAVERLERAAAPRSVTQAD